MNIPHRSSALPCFGSARHSAGRAGRGVTAITARRIGRSGAVASGTTFVLLAGLCLLASSRSGPPGGTLLTGFGSYPHLARLAPGLHKSRLGAGGADTESAFTISGGVK